MHHCAPFEYLEMQTHLPRLLKEWSSCPPPKTNMMSTFSQLYTNGKVCTNTYTCIDTCSAFWDCTILLLMESSSTSLCMDWAVSRSTCNTFTQKSNIHFIHHSHVLVVVLEPTFLISSFTVCICSFSSVASCLTASTSLITLQGGGERGKRERECGRRKAKHDPLLQYKPLTIYGIHIPG